MVTFFFFEILLLISQVTPFLFISFSSRHSFRSLSPIFALFLLAFFSRFLTEQLYTSAHQFSWPNQAFLIFCFFLSFKNLIYFLMKICPTNLFILGVLRGTFHTSGTYRFFSAYPQPFAKAINKNSKSEDFRWKILNFRRTNFNNQFLRLIFFANNPSREVWANISDFWNPDSRKILKKSPFRSKIRGTKTFFQKIFFGDF